MTLIGIRQMVHVIPAKAGIHITVAERLTGWLWVPAFAGETNE
jgi:hypothetical protein